jgi:hypothetical protein
MSLDPEPLSRLLGHPRDDTILSSGQSLDGTSIHVIAHPIRWISVHLTDPAVSLMPSILLRGYSLRATDHNI